MGDWKDNIPGRASGSGSNGESLTERYRRLTEELRAKEEYDEERDRVKNPRTPETGGTNIPKPWEGITELAQAMGINLGDLWKAREQELSDAKKSTTAMEQELHELRVREIDRRVEELQALVVQAKEHIEGDGQNPRRNPLSNVEEAVDKLIAGKIEKLFGDGQPQLTKEDIQQIAIQAVNTNKNGDSSPQQLVDTFMTFITAADEAKKKMVELGGGQGGSAANPYLTQAGSLRSDVLKILLDNDLEKLKAQQNYDIQQERNKHLGALAGAVKNNLEDIISASRERVQEHRESKDKWANDGERGYAVRCSECGEISVYPEMPAGAFPCQHCGAQLQLQEETKSGSRRLPPRPSQKPSSSMVGLDF